MRRRLTKWKPEREQDRWAGPLLAFMVSKVGFGKAIVAATLLLQWGNVARTVGREPTRAEFVQISGRSQAMYYRDLQVFRAIWPEDPTPQRVWEWVETKVDGQDFDEQLSALLLSEL